MGKNNNKTFCFFVWNILKAATKYILDISLNQVQKYISSLL